MLISKGNIVIEHLTPSLECFVPGRPFHPSVMKHSSLLGSFICCEENEELLMQFYGLYSQHLFYLQTLMGPIRLECLSLTNLSSLAQCNTLAYQAHL
jgi:hypothetical protein